MKTLLTVVLQHAGAERVVLFTRNEGVLRVSADADAEGHMTLLRLSDRDTSIPYVRRAVAESERNVDPIVVGDAMSDEPYASDADVHDRQVRSIMVLPLKHGGSSLGVLYLVSDHKIIWRNHKFVIADRINLVATRAGCISHVKSGGESSRE